MKKAISLLLTLAMLLGIGSMVSAFAADAGVKVGFGRHDFTPNYEVPLAGYTTTRYGSETLTPEDRLLSTVVAIADGSGNTVLICTSDMTRIYADWITELRKAMSKASGVPENNIHISATHTHSSIEGNDPIAEKGTEFYSTYINGFAKAAKEAVDDLTSVTVKVGKVNIPYLNQLRHYWRANGHINGANFESTDGGKWLSNPTQADNEVQIIRFVREGKKDVLMLNWQAHPITASASTDYGKAHKPYISADFIGYCRNYLEKQDGDCLVAYYTGASGNVNPYHLVPKYRDFETCPQETPLHGERLAGYILPALQNLKTIDPTGPVKQMQMFAKTPDNGLSTIVPFELNAISVGKSIGFVTAPYEMVSEHGMYVKENSPFEITFVLYLCNGRGGYIPSLYTYDYSELFPGNPQVYETYVCKSAKGTGEDFAQSMVNMLNLLYK
ncbi:MAG: neutral/alkaline non-lysosomal ceramidase N-terminal domain-containing protein [Oscillospiraceae bacterium]|nr:neutral/alkaline non-lysosomal ceramidase N-terminal domain-containing protein [Oscillospiraceae bacterium]